MINTFQSKGKIKDKIFPFPKMSQNKDAINDGFPAKKISVNFDWFNPKKKGKEDTSSSP